MGLFDRLLGRSKEPLQLREAQFAGMKYPEDADTLRGRIEALLAEGEAPTTSASPRALIVPHADYAVVGPTMSAAYRTLMQSDGISRVLLIGSSRLVPFRGLAATGYDGFETPLGPVVIDRDRLAEVAESDAVRPLEPVFDPEASIEVQLPFLQTVLEEFGLIPLIVGDARAEEVARIIGPLLDEPDALVVVSANMSHDEPAERADILDAELEEAIEALDAEVIGRDHSLERVALRGLLGAASDRQMTAHKLARTTSKDAADAPSATVSGYGAFALYREGDEP